MNEFNNEDYWKAIILYGLNQATYKIALGKVLLDFSKDERTLISWEELSRAFLDHYKNRINERSLPQQSNPTRQTEMEKIVSQLRIGVISFDKAVQLVGDNAFNDVLPRFHNIGKNKDFALNRFFKFSPGKSIEISPLTHEIKFQFGESAELELDSRWSLLEGAFSLTRGDTKLENDLRDIYLTNGYSRTPLTKNIPFLGGYQCNLCFYCGESLSLDSIDVDHVLPRQVVQHDEVWNLVLSHSTCNGNKLDAVVGEHYIIKLIARNENIMGSNHPWKKKIELALGDNPLKRSKNLRVHYENVKTVLKGNFWRGNPTYNAENDLFYRRLITRLNNK